MTPLSPDCRYLAAVLFFTDMLVSCLYKGQREGFRSANNVILMLANSQNDTDGQSDKAAMKIVGTSI